MSSVNVTASSNSTVAPKAANQGVLQGENPSVYNVNDPITLFIIQAVIIIVVCRLLHFPLSFIRQPRVIAEVLGGIVLGPTVFGHIPNFTATIFPTASMATLNMVANLGLVLFLFLVGLEVDLRIFGGNWKVALSVGALGMTLPFGLGVAVAYGLYHQFRNDAGVAQTVNFGVFALFIGVAMAITAFPVLARILTELKLLGTPVGTIVLSAGVGNDVVGWILLALTVALVNAGSGLSALWVLLVCIGWVLIHVYVFRPILRWVVKKTGSDSNGPSQPVVAFILIMTLISAFFTGIIGVHPIFGGFLVGLICPHENGFKSKMTEKIEDLVSVLFLPLYFALSGLKTNIGLLNDGITWGYVIAVLVIAFVAKIAGGTIAARCSKLLWRESFTIGVLMSCKGLVELIVLNIGLSAGVISTRVFTIFVVMALVTTFATTPITTFLYPKWYQDKVTLWRDGKINWDETPTSPSATPSEADTITDEKTQHAEIRRLMVYLRLDSLPAIFTFIGLLGHSDEAPEAAKHNEKDAVELASDQYQKQRTEALVNRKRPLEVHGVRMLELSERISTVMRDLESSDYPNRDPVINVFRSFSLMNSLAVSADVTVTNQSAYADSLQYQAKAHDSDLLLVPWSETGNLTEEDNTGAMAGRENRYHGANHNHFISQIMSHTPVNACDLAVFVNRGLGGQDGQHPSKNRPNLSRNISSLSLVSQAHNTAPTLPSIDRSHHIFFPFFGGDDDRAALRFVTQLAANTHVTVTVINYRSSYERKASNDTTNTPTTASGLKGADATTTEMHENHLDHGTYFSSIINSLPQSTSSRVLVVNEGSSQPFRAAVDKAAAENASFSHNAGNIIVLGRNRELTSEMEAELKDLTGAGPHHEDGHGGDVVKKNLGYLAQALLHAEEGASLLVFKSGTHKSRR